MDLRGNLSTSAGYFGKKISSLIIKFFTICTGSVLFHEIVKTQSAIRSSNYFISASAGVNQAGSFTLLNETTGGYWPNYLIAWLFRLLQFYAESSLYVQIAANIPIAMMKIFGFI
jgi:fucose 4-O-acetylase-like acetyltransferase